MKLNFSTYEGSPGGFVAEHDGYLCFIEPRTYSGKVDYQWLVQIGGSWTDRGGEDTQSVAEGTSRSSADAEIAIVNHIESLDESD